MSIEEQREILEKFYYKLFYGQEEIDPEFVRVINENFWELLGNNEAKKE